IAAEDRWRDVAINIIVVATQEEKRLTKRAIVRKARALTEREKHPVRVRDFVHHASKYWEESATPKEIFERMGLRILADSGPGFRLEQVGKSTKSILLTDDYCPVDTMFQD
ncbi:MAG: hypothetical protein ACYTFI_05650, partial [Planctomycetota bacterium]